MEKFLITDAVPEGFIERFEAAGFEVDYHPVAEDILLQRNIQEYTGIVVNTSMYLDKARLEKAARLRYILRPGSGLDNVDLVAAREKGIAVFSSPEANSVAVAEHAAALLLSLMNYIPRASEAVRNFQWVRKPNMGTQLKGKTLAIIGYGNTGSAFASRMRSFDCELLCYDKYKSNYAPSWLRESTMGEIFEKADVLSLHIPLTEETHHLVDEAFINSFRKPFFLVNTSRGGIVHTEELLSELKKGKIQGAALDVLENENPGSYSDVEREILQGLLQQNVIITPHIAGWTKEAREGIFMLVQEKFFEYLARNH